MFQANDDNGTVLDGDLADLADVVVVAIFDGVCDVVRVVGDIEDNDDFKTEV